MQFAITALALASAFASPSRAQPILHEEYEGHQEGFPWEDGNGGSGKLLSGCTSGGGTQSEYTCEFSRVLSSQPEKPSIREYLAMFSDKYVKHNDRFYAVKNSQGNGAMTFSKDMKNGLYELLVPHPLDGHRSCRTSGRCVHFKLLFEADDIGQIIASTAKYSPIRIIGVDQVSDKIYGYYPDADGTWTRKPTSWGDAKNGSLRSGSETSIIGLSTNDRLVHLWGDFHNFNYAKHDDIECSGAPSGIDAWSGHLEEYRGIYCPGADDNQLRKLIWDSDAGGWAKEELIWAPASKITRFDNGIKGITTDGKLLILWNDAGTVRSVPVSSTDLPSIHGIRAVGGPEDEHLWGTGNLLSNGDDVVYTVWWDGKWKEKEIFIDKRFSGEGKISIFFGSHGGEIYMLYGWFDNNIPWVCRCSLHEVYLYHMKFVGGTERYQATRIQGDTSV